MGSMLCPPRTAVAPASIKTLQMEHSCSAARKCLVGLLVGGLDIQWLVGGGLREEGRGV